jgi:putative ABC transport system substrate-binding protein
MKRREFIALGAAAALPMPAWAQQAVPVVGFLGSQSADNEYKYVIVPFLQGLKESGYVEGQNVAVEYRHAENQFGVSCILPSVPSEADGQMESQNLAPSLHEEI